MWHHLLSLQQSIPYEPPLSTPYFMSSRVVAGGHCVTAHIDGTLSPPRRLLATGTLRVVVETAGRWSASLFADSCAGKRTDAPRPVRRHKLWVRERWPLRRYPRIRVTTSEAKYRAVPFVTPSEFESPQA